MMSEITARLSTAIADRYQIEKRLGEGGMGPLITLMNTDTSDV